MSPHTLTDDALRAEPDPLVWFTRWYDEARRGPAEPPNALVLATVDAEGRPDARVVLLACLDAAGFVWMTNCESRKGRQLVATPEAALVFHWPAQGRQVRARGSVEAVDAVASDAYFARRPRGSQVGAWASDQSRPLPGGRAQLEARVADLTARFDGAAVPRPPHWGGYRLVPWELELWQAGEHRLHTRVRFTRDGSGTPWSHVQLYP
jgi:pyridoxamine 5'-phosphate oxidase